MRYAIILLSGLTLYLSSCHRNEFKHDASGTFEATETIISAEVTGKILELNFLEGDWLNKGQYLGYIDSTQLYLQKLQLEKTKKATNVKRPDISLQIAATKEQIAKAEIDKKRFEKLFSDNAATQQQLDNINSQLTVLQRTLTAQINSLTTSVNSLDEQSNVYELQVKQVEDQLSKCRLINPLEGMVLSKYVEEKEVVIPGKPLYKIANTKDMYLRAYLVSTQLNEVKIGQEVAVFINSTDDQQKSYKGTVTWISSKAEFTPKTIQTKDERQNLVYAIKIAVNNTDGSIKIGMYGDVDFK